MHNDILCDTQASLLMSTMKNSLCVGCQNLHLPSGGAAGLFVQGPLCQKSLSKFCPYVVVNCFLFLFLP